MRNDGMNGWPEVAPPVVALPAPGPVNAVLGFTIALLPIVAPLLVHQTTDYEIRTGPKGTGVVQYAAMASAGLLASIVPIGGVSTLAAGQTYYVRARFNTNGYASDWPADVVVTT